MIVMCVNEVDTYVEQLKTSLRSSIQNSPNTDIDVHLINFKDIEIEKEFPKVNFIRVDLPDANRSQVASYSSNATFNTLHRVKKPVVFIDTDTIVRKDLTDMLEVNSNTLKLVIREGLNEKNIFNTGVYVVGYSKPTLLLMQNWIETSKNEKSWCSDQRTLLGCYNKMKSKIDLQNLDFKYNDMGGRDNCFAQESSIWHCKASHFHEEKYQVEYRKYNDKTI